MPEGRFLEPDVRSTVRLLGDVAVFRGDLGERRARLLEGLAEIVDCDLWAWEFMSACELGEGDADGPISSLCPGSMLAKIEAPKRPTGTITLGVSGRCVLYVCPETDGLLPVIAFGRSEGRPPLTERELMLVRVVIGETEWLRRRDSLRPEGPAARRLAPRLRPVLAKLLDGHSVREMSSTLSLSEHSVRTYTRTIYKELGVKTRAELQHRVMTGQIGDPR